MTAGVHLLNEQPSRPDGTYVLYWLRRARRVVDNSALNEAAAMADESGKSVLACCVLPEPWYGKQERYWHFLLESLKEIRDSLAERGFKLIAVAPGGLDALVESASAVVTDGGFLREEVESRESLASSAACRVVFVETETLVPVDAVSTRREYAARTFRPKLNRCRDRFLRSRRTPSTAKSSLPLHVSGAFDLKQPASIRNEIAIDIDRRARPADRFAPGSTAGRHRLTRFLRQGLPGYADGRSDPTAGHASELSPYLAFGLLSPAEVARKVLRASGPAEEDKEAFLEELLVRRELAFNYVRHEGHYDAFSALPGWAKNTLAEHADDERDPRYGIRTLEAGKTDDEYWNAAMREMVCSGYMHNYMRMYWGKKILEWSRSPERAFEAALMLNNRYFLDGRTEPSFANVAWLFGLHDRAWQERPVFGKVRYMNASGLERKFDVERYVEWTKSLSASH